MPVNGKRDFARETRAETSGDGNARILRLSFSGELPYDARMEKIIAVTGGTGFLGSAVVRRCLERGWSVRVVGRRKKPDVETPGTEYFSCDVGRDAKRLAEIFAGADAVFHVAAKAGVWGSRRAYFDANVAGTRNVIAACREAGVRRLVHTSTPSVVFNGRDIDGGDESLPYCSPRSDACLYALSKAEAERLALAADGPKLRTVALRPHLIWGEGDPHLIPRVLEQASLGRLRIVGDGKNRVDLTHVENAAHAHMLALDALFRDDARVFGKAYFVSDGAPVALWDWIGAFLEGVGVPRPRADRAVPFRSARFAGTLLEIFWKLFAVAGEPPMTRFVASELAKSHWFKIDAARRDLGYAPVVDPAEAFARLVSLYKGRT